MNFVNNVIHIGLKWHFIRVLLYLQPKTYIQHITRTYGYVPPLLTLDFTIVHNALADIMQEKWTQVWDTPYFFKYKKSTEIYSMLQCRIVVACCAVTLCLYQFNNSNWGNQRTMDLSIVIVSLKLSFSMVTNVVTF